MTDHTRILTIFASGVRLPWACRRTTRCSRIIQNDRPRRVPAAYMLIARVQRFFLRLSWCRFCDRPWSTPCRRGRIEISRASVRLEALALRQSRRHQRGALLPNRPRERTQAHRPVSAPAGHRAPVSTPVLPLVIQKFPICQQYGLRRRLMRTRPPAFPAFPPMCWRGNRANLGTWAQSLWGGRCIRPGRSSATC